MSQGALPRRDSSQLRPSFFHRTAASSFEGSYSDFAGVRLHMQAMTNEGAIADCRAAFNWLRVRTDVWQKARFRRSDTAWVEGFRFSRIRHCRCEGRCRITAGIFLRRCWIARRCCTVRCYFSGEGSTNTIPPEQREQVIDTLKQNGKKYVNVEISDADHAFFCDARPAYDARASQLAWVLTLEFLK